VAEPPAPGNTPEEGTTQEDTPSTEKGKEDIKAAAEKSIRIQLLECERAMAAPPPEEAAPATPIQNTATGIPPSPDDTADPLLTTPPPGTLQRYDDVAEIMQFGVRHGYTWYGKQIPVLEQVWPPPSPGDRADTWQRRHTPAQTLPRHTTRSDKMVWQSRKRRCGYTCT